MQTSRVRPCIQPIEAKCNKNLYFVDSLWSIDRLDLDYLRIILLLLASDLRFAAVNSVVMSYTTKYNISGLPLTLII